METLSPEPSDSLEPAPIDFAAYGRTLLRKKWLILGCVCASVAVVAAWVLRQPKMYEAAVSVIIDAPPNVLGSGSAGDKGVQEVIDDGASALSWYSHDYYETQFRIIVSRAVATRVVDKLGLQNDDAFLGTDKIEDPALRQSVRAGADAVALLQSKIKVDPVKDSRLLYIRVRDFDADRAALLANEVAEAYKDENLDLKLKATETAEKWLTDRLDQLTGQSRTSEMKVYEFKKQRDMLTASLEDRLSMVSQQLTSYNVALTDVRTKIASLRARVDAIEEARKTVTQKDAHWGDALIDNGPAQQFRMKYINQRAECDALTTQYLPEHPKVLNCQEKLRTADRDLTQELDNMVRAAQLELFEARSKERNFVNLLEQSKGEAFDVNRKQIEFDHLKRDADNDQRLQELVLKRLKDIELSGLVRTSNARVLDAARPSYGAVSPRVYFSLLNALLVGLVLGIGLAFALEYLDTSINSREQVERWLGLTFLGVIPALQRGKEGLSPDLLVHEQPKSPMAECCRSVRTNLLFMSPDKPLRSILVTSCGPQDGKTTTAVSLAITMAESGKKVLLLDADMRRPRVHKVFSVANGVGLSSLILGQGEVDEAIKSTGIPNLSVLTCGPVPPNPAELLHTDAFAKLLRRLNEKFDVLLIDSPPVGPVSDPVVLSTQVDGTVFVLKAGNTSRDLARRSLRLLSDVKARIFGAVLNDLDITDRRYQGYYYYYYERYGTYAERKETAAQS